MMTGLRDPRVGSTKIKCGNLETPVNRLNLLPCSSQEATLTLTAPAFEPAPAASIVEASLTSLRYHCCTLTRPRCIQCA